MSIRLRDLLENAGGSVPPAIFTPPVLSSISPATGVVNTAATVSCNGSGFTPSSVVLVNGVARPTTFVSTTQVRVTFTPSSATTYPLVVRNGTLSSASKTFTATVSGAEVFDPGAATVAEVIDYVDAHPDETQAVLDAEEAGKNRSTLVTALEERLA